MAIRTRHPQYAEFSDDWVTMRDTYRGERLIKQQGVKYLPPTSGMVADGMGLPTLPGQAAYDAYKMRAVFPDFVAEAVEVAIGMMHCRPPEIELPAALESLRDRATINGEGLEQLLRRINEQQLVMGRLGLMADLPLTPNPEQPLPYISLYKAEHLINWDDKQPDDEVEPRLTVVVLDESELERTSDFDWEIVEKYRLLTLVKDDQPSNERGAVYGTAVFKDRDAGFDIGALVYPTIRGTMLEKLPFVIINTKDLVASPDDPPLLGLARLALAVYRGEADYRHNLFMQGQDTLVLIGDMSQDDTKRVGAGALVRLPVGGDAKYVGVTGQGLAEQRQALENDRKNAMLKTGAMLNNAGGQKESGEALKIRVAAQTASLNQIAKTGAGGLQQLLRTVAEWAGANPEEVKVTPNLEFAGSDLDTKGLLELVSAKTMGTPISWRSIHGLMADRGITKMTYEDEQGEIEVEAPMPTAVDPNADPDEPDPKAEDEEPEA